jgi:hypothetical protein
LSPDENPFDGGSLAAVAPNANSRFFTDCYHRPPQSRQGLGGRRDPRFPHRVPGELFVAGAPIIAPGASEMELEIQRHKADLAACQSRQFSRDWYRLHRP